MKKTVLLSIVLKTYRKWSAQEIKDGSTHRMLLCFKPKLIRALKCNAELSNHCETNLFNSTANKWRSWCYLQRSVYSNMLAKYWAGGDKTTSAVIYSFCFLVWYYCIVNGAPAWKLFFLDVKNNSVAKTVRDPSGRAIKQRQELFTGLIICHTSGEWGCGGSLKKSFSAFLFSSTRVPFNFRCALAKTSVSKVRLPT